MYRRPSENAELSFKDFIFPFYFLLFLMMTSTIREKQRKPD